MPQQTREGHLREGAEGAASGRAGTWVLTWGGQLVDDGEKEAAFYGVAVLCYLQPLSQECCAFFIGSGFTIDSAFSDEELHLRQGDRPETRRVAHMLCEVGDRTTQVFSLHLPIDEVCVLRTIANDENPNKDDLLVSHSS